MSTPLTERQLWEQRSARERQITEAFKRPDWRDDPAMKGWTLAESMIDLDRETPNFHTLYLVWRFFMPGPAGHVYRTALALLLMGRIKMDWLGRTYVNPRFDTENPL